jgi:hypothetical protein
MQALSAPYACMISQRLTSRLPLNCQIIGWRIRWNVHEVIKMRRFVEENPSTVVNFSEIGPIWVGHSRGEIVLREEAGTEGYLRPSTDAYGIRVGFESIGGGPVVG